MSLIKNSPPFTFVNVSLIVFVFFYLFNLGVSFTRSLLPISSGSISSFRSGYPLLLLIPNIRDCGVTVSIPHAKLRSILCRPFRAFCNFCFHISNFKGLHALLMISQRASPFAIDFAASRLHKFGKKSFRFFR